MGEGAGQKRAGGPVVVLGHEGGTRAEGSEVERVDKMWWSIRLMWGAWCQRACEQRTVHWFHRLPFNSLTIVWFGRGGGGGGAGSTFWAPLKT